MTSSPRFTYFVAASLDGFIADPDGGLEWLLRFDGAEGVAAHYERFLEGIGALVMGRKTFDFVHALGGVWPYPGRATWVLTHRPLPVVEGADLRVTTDVARALPAIEASAGGRDVWVVGGGEVAAQVFAEGRLDELHLAVVPVFLGRGVPLLPARTGELELIATTHFGRGLVEHRYRIPRPSTPPLR